MALDDRDVVTLALAAADRIQRLDWAILNVRLEPRTLRILREAHKQTVEQFAGLDERIQAEPTDMELRAQDRVRAAAKQWEIRRRA